MVYEGTIDFSDGLVFLLGKVDVAEVSLVGLVVVCAWSCRPSSVRVAVVGVASTD